MSNALSWLASNWVLIAVTLLTVDKALERLFPNATFFQGVDKTLSGIVPPDEKK